MRFPVIVVDVPWEFRRRAKDGGARSASAHYRVSPSQHFAPLPIKALAERRADVYMWVTGPHIDEAVALGRCWGLDFGTLAFVWIKTIPRWQQVLLAAVRARGGAAAVELITSVLPGGIWNVGMGYSTRANAELVFRWTVGGGLPRQSKKVRQLLIAPRTLEHSEKPNDELHLRLAQLTGISGGLEIFARRRFADWVTTGDDPRVDLVGDVFSTLPALCRAKSLGGLDVVS